MQNLGASRFRRFFQDREILLSWIRGVRRVADHCFWLPMRLFLYCFYTVDFWRKGAASSTKIIIFLVNDNMHFISGGLLSILNLDRFSREMQCVHGAKIFVCFLPEEGWHYCRFRMSDNDTIIYPLEFVLARCSKVKDMLLHVPDYALEVFMQRLGPKRLAQLRSEKGMRINILNQNIQLMPADSVIVRLREEFPGITCTCAHPSYSTAAYQQRWGIPLHHLPAWTYPDDASATSYETKQDIMIVSPDPSVHRESVLGKISKELPHLQICVVSKMPFRKYLKLTRIAKWSLTFGEGMDDYFMGVSMRGGIGFAVYNTEFFTPDFASFQTIYPDWNALLECIVKDIKSLDNKESMESYNSQLRPFLTRIWSAGNTRRALVNFYEGHLNLA
jgi:hypothetical protein